jgi:hypothetical protein
MAIRCFGVKPPTTKAITQIISYRNAINTQVSGGLKLALSKNPKTTGLIEPLTNFPKTCGNKNPLQ